MWQPLWKPYGRPRHRSPQSYFSGLSPRRRGIIGQLPFPGVFWLQPLLLLQLQPLRLGVPGVCAIILSLSLSLYNGRVFSLSLS